MRTKIPLRYLLWGSPNVCSKTESPESCLHLPCIELVPPPLLRVFAHPATGSLIVIKQAINSGRDKKRTVSPLAGWLLDGVVSLRFASIVDRATINSIEDADKLAMCFGICQILQDVKCAGCNNCWNFLLLENDSRPIKDPACPPPPLSVSTLSRRSPLIKMREIYCRNPWVLSKLKKVFAT